MDVEDGNSSEGIVCSSDDEFDGLSEAVENHIMGQESTTNVPIQNFQSRLNSNQFHNRGYEDVPLERSQFSAREHIRKVPDRFHTDHFPIQQQHPDLPLQGRYTHIHGGEYRHLAAEQSFPPPHILRNSPPKRAILTPRQDVMRRNLSRNNRAAHEMRHVGPPPMPLPQGRQHVPPPGYMGNNPGHILPGPPVYPENLPPHVGTRSHSSERYLPVAHIGNVPNPLPVAENYDIVLPTNAEPARSRSMEAYHEEHQFEYDSKKMKMPPKPVLFKIKSKPQPKVEYAHPLDPFSPPSEHGIKKEIGARRWSHDKYEEQHYENMKLKKEVENIKESPRIVKREETKRNEKGRRKRRTRNSAESPLPVMAIKAEADRDQIHRKRRRTRSSQRTKSNTSSKFSESWQSMHKSPKKESDSMTYESDRKVTLVEEEVDETDIVYEEEEVLEHEDTVSHLETRSFASDSEDDEELLALRLNALTSALPPSVEASESRKDFEDDEELRLRLNALTSSIDAKIRVNKTKESSQEKKPKHMLRRVMETPKRASRRRRSMRKSGVADQFLKQYSAISDSPLKKPAKKKPPVKPARKVAVNYNAPQLTLFGEIVKNHQTTTKTDALRYIRHHPDEAAKTDIFLNLMKRDELNVTEVVDLHKQNLNQNKAKPKEGKTSQANDDKTNYDEIEMDLDDGDSDTNLVPPGTDRCLIKPPALEPLDVPETSKEQDLNSTAAEIKKQSPSAVPATPTQESIWSMLEHSTLLAPADQDIDSTITDAKKERPRVGTPSQESMWSMLEHPSVLNEKTVSGSPEATEKRVRISSEDAEIDDESLVMLREVLLQQLDKNQPKELAPKPDNTVSSSSEKMQVAAEKDQEVNLLPSQYPYQPPTLFLQSSLLTKTNAITSVTPTSTVAVLNEKDPSVHRPNTRASAALRAAVDQKAVPSSPAVFPSGSNTPILRSSSPSFRVAPVPPLHIANPGAFESGLGAVAVYSPSGLSEITKAAIAMSSINMTSIHFKPPMASTPAVPLTPKPNKLRGKAFWKARKKQRRKAARAAKKQKMKNSSGATQNAGVLKPVAVNITNTPKGHPLNTGMSRSAQLLNQPPAGVTVKTSNIAKLTSTEATVASGLKNQSTDPAKLVASSASTQSPQTLTAALKPQTPKIKPGASKSCAQSSQLSTLSQKTVPKSPISEDLVTSTQTSQSQNTVLKNSPKVAISMGPMPPGGSISTQSSNTSAKSLTSPDNSTRSLKLSNVTAPSSVLKNPPKAATSVTTATSAQLAKTVLPGPPTVSSQKVVVKPVANLDSSAQSMKLSTVLTQSSTTVMNNPPKVTISGGLKSSAQTSKTVFKSATTLIKSTRVSSKRPAESSSPDPAKRKALVAAEAAVDKPVHLRLPRHQPVVVNIGGSSDEDDSVLSPTRHRNTAQNPLDYHKNMLEAMIKQARAQTSVKQKTKEDDKAKKLSSPQNANQTLKVSSGQNAERPLPKTQPQVKNSSKSASGKNTSVKQQTSAEIKSKVRPQKQSSVGQNHKDTVSHLKQTREKFLKLKTLIGKDEVAYARFMKIKESKRSELKAVEDELKEMIHRVAAIKGKAARCEDLIKRYEQQETKIKTRLEKREGLKLKLKDRIKRQMLKARSEQLAKKMEAVTNTADTKSNQNAATVSKATVNVSPAKSQSQEKLDQEKQRLLAVEQQLAAEINKMKKSDGNAAATGPRRVSLSKAVRSHLAKYKETKKSNNPTAHDLSLSKIAITALSPVRNLQTTTPTSALSPARKLLMSPVSSRGASPVAQKVDSAAVVETNEIKKNDEQGSIESNPVEEKSSDVASEVELGKLRKSLHRNFTDSKSLLQECDQPFPDFSHSAKSWHKKTPDFFKNWKVDVSEVISQSNREDINERRTYEFQLYESPLRTFRSYRLSPFLRMKEKLTIKSRTFSHKINPEQILCKYDLTGTCQDPDCKCQHLKQYELSSSELILDLLSYCPELLGENLNKDLEYKDLIKLAESACDKLCGTSNNQTNTMSVDEKCILITSKINATLRNKAPFTTVMRPRKITILQDRNKMPWKNYLQQDFDVDNDGFINTGKVISLNLENKIEHPDSFVKDDERYFIERNPGSLYRIEEALKQNPHDIQLWLELAYKKMQKRSDGQQSSLEIGLHTMCLALEENPYVGELWGHYLGLLRRHKGAESEQDRNEMVSQAIELVPLSTHVWNQLLSWDCDIIKREFLYDQLISNLIRNVES